ncbi:Glucans biosynthesis protein D precursor [Kluyvera cryocrescens]|uniref:Glucans biosynthesis protein D n=1 Tax=Kluyvera cryocrescens TaxID=580 RepID=A0A485CQ16_KLUCR|nr:Glucans biosynthesis protein D precursor [Kluyvera cryocrescens]
MGGKGAVSLMEIPTTGETLDNIVCFWQPEKPMKAGDTMDFSYRLYWSAMPPIRSPLARVLATRTGMGSFPEGWAPGEHYPEKWSRRFAIGLRWRRPESGRTEGHRAGYHALQR